MSYTPLGLPYIQLGRSIRYSVPDVARWIMERRSQESTPDEVKEMIDALGGAACLLDEKETARAVKLSVATLQTDRCRTPKSNDIGEAA